jgi:hypothetical protein
MPLAGLALAPRRWSAIAAAPLGLAALMGLSACDEAERSALARSCAGERVLECDPHEYTAVRAASLLPEGIGPLDPTARAMVRVEVETCPGRPDAPVAVQLFALLGATDGGGGPVRVIDLGETLRDDGTAGDEVAGDGVIEQEIGNPFGREIPERTRITLRFVPVLAGCQGDPLELPYTTGARYVPPAP